jgi:hypothetical protein
MLNLCCIVVAILKMATARNLSMSGHHYLTKYQILMISDNAQYRTNSTLFDFNVLNWFPTSKNLYRSPFSKWPPQYCKNSTLFDYKFFDVGNQFRTLKSNNVEFVRYCGGHFNHILFLFLFLVHLDQRSMWTIAITWRPSSVVCRL